jgi:hypothetical protein
VIFDGRASDLHLLSPTNMIIVRKYRVCSNLIIVRARRDVVEVFGANSIPSEAKFSKCFLLTLLRLSPNIQRNWITLKFIYDMIRKNVAPNLTHYFRISFDAALYFKRIKH